MIEQQAINKAVKSIIIVIKAVVATKYYVSLCKPNRSTVMEMEMDDTRKKLFVPMFTRTSKTPIRFFKVTLSQYNLS